MSPQGIVPKNQSLWMISTDVDIVPPRDPNVSAVFYKTDPSAANAHIEVTRVTAEYATYESRRITFDTGNIVWEEVSH